ncbi:UvrD-helicase domain-containing protein [Streptomyces sp. NPDC004647]|uniref:UvrD-helicase domain-containing protein n=1 Tax=Streptomyces sp. NPDC004647 TaxID=3154671 RepID=UPI0033BC1FF7
MGPYEGIPDLTEEQLAVVRQPADALLLVTAGAGAGKTHTLVRRLEALVQDQGLSAGEILVFSFSRAAVRELRERLLRNGGEDVRQIRVSTFDSWVLRMLSEHKAETDWRSTGFEARIEAAAAAIADDRDDEIFGDTLRHVVIDEVQDLVGARRNMVEALLEQYDCSFTLVGDPAQAIYNFQVQDPDQRAIETNRFFAWLRNFFTEELTERSLSGNFRARTPEARTALRHEAAVRAGADLDREDSEKLHSVLREELMALDEFGNLDVPYVQNLLRDDRLTTAVLCRTNGEALLISGTLHEAGISHQLRRSAQDRSAPAWLNSLIRGAGGLVLTRKGYDALFPSLTGLPSGIEIDSLWRLLRSCAGDRTGRTVDLSVLRDDLAAGHLHDELTAQSPHHLVVSTFHRAKGLEFDRVLVVDPGPLKEVRTGGRTDPAEEARMLYVAMTRPRDELYWLPRPATRLVRKDPSTGRWGRYGWQKWQRLGLEMHGTDVHAVHPAGTHGFTADALDLQEYLRIGLPAGAALTFELLDTEESKLEAAQDAGMAPPYVLCHETRAIGLASEGFRRDMYRFRQRWPQHRPDTWPGKVTGIQLDSVETVSGSPAAGATAGMGDLGIWLAPRLTGLGRFHYDKTTNAAEDDNG